MKMKIIHLAVMALSVAYFSGCAPLPYNHLEQDAHAFINETDVVLAVPQEEIYGDIESSNLTAAAGGGLLFALIDAMVESSRASNAEEAVTPVRDKLLDYDYAQVLAEEINNQIQTIEWLSADDVQLERSTNDTWVTDKVSSSSASAILLMTARYHLTPNLDSVETMVSLRMYPNSNSLEEYKEKQDVDKDVISGTDNIYRNDLTASTVLFSGSTKDANRLSLESDDGTKLKDALDKNAKKIARMIYQDLNIDGASDSVDK